LESTPTALFHAGPLGGSPKIFLTRSATRGAGSDREGEAMEGQRARFEAADSLFLGHPPVYSLPRWSGQEVDDVRVQRLGG